MSWSDEDSSWLSAFEDVSNNGFVTFFNKFGPVLSWIVLLNDNVYPGAEADPATEAKSLHMVYPLSCVAALPMLHAEFTLTNQLIESFFLPLTMRIITSMACCFNKYFWLCLV